MYTLYGLQNPLFATNDHFFILFNGKSLQIGWYILVKTLDFSGFFVKNPLLYLPLV